MSTAALFLALCAIAWGLLSGGSMEWRVLSITAGVECGIVALLFAGFEGYAKNPEGDYEWRRRQMRAEQKPRPTQKAF